MCLITKDVFETHIQNLYNNMKKIFKISWSPKKFIVTMEIDPKKSKGWGGNTNYDIKTNTFLLTLQLFGFSKNEQTISIIEKLFGYVLTHEMLHFFIPYVQNNSCWSEGVTDTISENLFRLKKEYKEITDPSYKQHKFGYLSGFKKMVTLYEDNPSVIDDMKRIIKDFNKNDKNRQKIYTQNDIIEYNPKFVVFFIGKCNTHVKHEL